MSSYLSDQVQSISNITKAVVLSDISKITTVDMQGEILNLKVIINAMVAQLLTLVNEVTRVSLEVSTEGILDGQASVPDATRHVEGTLSGQHSSSPCVHQALTDNVNLIAIITCSTKCGRSQE